MQRIPEPELMDDPAQAAAYAGADFSIPNALFVETALSHLGSGSGRLIDLGCGPGDICLRLARALPGWQIVGLDAGPNMIALASQAAEQAGLADRIELIQARLPDHGQNHPFDAVVSNSLLHHLPDPMVLWHALCDLATARAYVQVMDLHRPASPAAARAMVEASSGDEPRILREDFYNSLCAAWTAEEIHAQLDRAGLADLQLSRPTERHWMVSGYLAGQE
ncbi:MAG: class I SAM-dependent methyltransferase [Pseudomonadota bacterium]|nr:MAG: class I SAM-dependent methyltransferase [Pseudomonadota bacterium]